MTGRRRPWAIVAVVLAVLVVAGTVLTVVLVNRKPSSYGAVDCAHVSAGLTSGLAALERPGPVRRYDQQCIWASRANPGVGLGVRATTRFTPPDQQEPGAPWSRAAAGDSYDRQTMF